MDNELLLEQIKKLESLYDQVSDRTTFAYLQLLDSLRYEYEKAKMEKHCIRICSEIEQCVLHNEYKDDINNIYLSSLDTRARYGDFRAYCIALEWNRPIDKQFFLPRRRVMEKHGLIQAFQDVADDKLDFLFISMSPRVGKMLADDTPILTKDGWKTHGDLKVGDYVLNDKGRFVMVQAISQEQECTHIIRFANGEEFYTHANHEWVAYDRHSGNSKIVETNDMIGKLRDNYGDKPTKNHYRFSVPLIEPISGEYKELPVAPYSLGAWLGDGTHNKPCTTNDKNDIDIIQSIEKDGYLVKKTYVHPIYGTITTYFNNLRNDLQKIGLCHSRERNIKYIPDVYFTASLQQRLELLAGLLDTDGTLSKKEHRYHFSTTSIELKEDFIKLVSTFGWRCSVSEYEPTLSSSGIQGKKKVYQIGFNPTMHIPCRLERKQLREFSKQRRITITDIQPIKEHKKGHCIQVEGGIYLAGKTMIPTHNSTLGIFFLTFMAGLYPGRAILGNGHSVALAQSFYNETLNIMMGEEYRFHEIFSSTKIVNKSAEYNYIDLNNSKRFHTIMFKSVDGGTTGLAEASNVLYCDDLIKDVETANNPDRLDKLFATYTSTIQDRKVSRKCKDGAYRPCPEIWIATRWSINDPIGRLIDIYSQEDSERIRIINIPCYDENGESNFMYDYGKGFDKNYYHHLEMAEDPVIFAAKYLGQPIEREGRPFTKDQLTFYSELPEEEPDWIVAYADVAHGGDDYFSMPIGYVYGNEVYIEDVLFVNKLDVTKTRPLVCDKLIQHNVTRAGFEENNGGKLYADWIVEDLKRRKYRCNITTHKVPTTKSKLDRIMSCQSEIKGVATEQGTYRIYFKSDKLIMDNKQYMDFMRITYNWSQKTGSTQKTQHDDSCFDGNTLIATEFGDKKIKDIRVGDKVITPFGLREVVDCGITGYKPTINKFNLNVTPNHKIYNKQTSEFTPVNTLTSAKSLDIMSLGGMIKWKLKLSYLMDMSIEDIRNQNTISDTKQKTKIERTRRNYIEQCGNTTMDLSLKDIKFIIKIPMLITMTFLIWFVYRLTNICRCTVKNFGKILKCVKNYVNILMTLETKRVNGTNPKKDMRGIKNTLTCRLLRRGDLEKKENVNGVVKHSLRKRNMQNVVQTRVPENIEFIEKQKFVQTVGTHFIPRRKRQNIVLKIAERSGKLKPVYNVKVKDAGCYYANGILVSNCDSLAGLVTNVLGGKPSAGRASIKTPLSKLGY